MINPDAAFIVEGISKKYRIGVKKSETINEAFTKFFHRSGQDKEASEFWALKDVSFQVNTGDAVGIIGKNGAGKSTLLKILSKITKPDTGRVEIRGRVASLLEVGTGFHPELSGRENIFLNGTILGMSQKEVKSKFDEIVEFSGVSKFIDTPVKHYSSGMYVRLAFAVAAHLEPEILIIDEVLAVGDAEFQRKCLGKMGQVAGEGRTVIFVSHNMAAVKSLCHRGIVLKQGEKVFEGEAEQAIEYYQSTHALYQNTVLWEEHEAPGNENVKLVLVDVNPLEGNLLSVDSGVMIEVQIINYKAGTNLDCTLEVLTKDDTVVFHQGVFLSKNKDSQKGRYIVKASLPGFLLNSGFYKLNLIIGENQRVVVFQMQDIVAFEIENTATGQGSNMSKIPGVIRPKLDWQVEFKSVEKIL